MVAILTTATADLGTDLLAVAGLGLAVGVSVYGVKKGWKFFRSLI